MSRIFAEMKNMTKIWVLLLALLAGAAEAVTDTFNASGTWTAPAGVTSVTVETWAGGGAGGGATGNPAKGGGGAGGQYAKKVVTVVPGNIYAVVVGAGGAGGTANGGVGGDSTFAGTLVVAKGGAGGTGAVNGAGGLGSTVGGVGDIVYAGGNGASSTVDTNCNTGGAGGGGAGSTGAGGNAAGNTGGAGTAIGGGAGGSATNGSGNGAAGAVAGGGGAGACAENNTDRSGGVGAAGRVDITYTPPPVVSSINCAGACTTSAASASWTVVFDQSVSGVNSGNFALVNTGLGGAPAITSVTGGGTTWTVTASTGTGTGTLGLNMVNATGVSPAVTGLPVTGQVHTLDRTAPAVSSIARVNPTPTALASVSWTVTFSENVTGVDAADFALVQAGGVNGALITAVTPVSGTVYTVTASTGTGSGTLGLNLVDDDSIIDAVSNPLGGTGAGNGNAIGEVYTVTRPTVYYHDTTAGVNIGFDGTTNVTSGTNQTIPPIITASLTTANTCTGSARSADHPTGLYTHSRWYLNTNYAVATDIAANPSGSAVLYGNATTDTVIASLYDYNPVSGAKALIGSSPAITLTGGRAAVAYPYTISSPVYTMPAGHRLMLEYNFNQPGATNRARVYCSAASSYIAVTETAATLVVSASASTVVAYPASVVADNVSTSMITVTLKTGSGIPVPGKTVTLAAGSGSSVITTVSGTTDASGVATFTVKDGTIEGPITYTATDTTDSIVITQTAQVTFTAPVLCFTDSFAGTLGVSWSVGSNSGGWTPAIVSGRLRLTEANAGQSTWATLQQPFPAAGNKATVEFEHFAYGGTGADGIAVVFSDASVAPVAGAFGGSLGYAQKSNPGSDCTIVGGCPGFAGGWLGIALDEYGNFSNPTEGRFGGTGQVADSVSIRGSGTGMAGYRFLQGTGTLSPGVDGNNVPPGTVPHRYRIIVDHTDSVHAYVSVERDTASGVGSAYTTLIAPFDVKEPGYSQSAIPTSFNLSFTGSTGAATNIHEIGNLSVCTGLAMVVPTLHHIEIDHNGDACTSGTTPVTVKACADADCTALYLGSVTVDLSPDAGGGRTWTPAEPVTFTGGSVTLALANTTANTLTLGGTATPIAASATRCFNGAAETCSLVFSACTVDAVEVNPASVAGGMIYTKLAGTAFNLHAVRTGGGNQAVSNVELVDASSGTCDTYTPLVGTILPAAFTLSGGNPRQTVAFTYNDAAPNVRVRMTTPGPVLSCSSDNFAIRPLAFTVTSSASNPGTGGAPVFRAGADAFSLTASAGYGGYTGIPRFNSSLISTSLGNPGTVTMADFPAATSGVSITSGLYNEVGNFNLAQYAVYDDSFANVDSNKTNPECIAGFSNTLDANGKYSCQFGSTAAGPFGRFIPDHFDTAVVATATVPMPCPGGLTCPVSYNGFVYSGQPFSVQVIARNLAGATTANYDGALGYAKAVTLGAWGGAAGGAAQNPGPGALANNTIAADAFGAGVATTATPAYTLAAVLTAPTNIFLRAVDTDNVTSLRAVPEASVEGGVMVASGRVKISSAHGSELLPLPIAATVQYWNGAWVASVSDIATTISASDFALAFPAGTASRPNNLAACETALSIAGGSPNFRVNLSAPGNGNNGWTDLTLNLGATAAGSQCIAVGGGGAASTTANRPWLQFPWGGGAATNPTARATFGVHKGSNEFIYLREVY